MNKQPNHPYLYHLVQAERWRAAKAASDTYYPPTFDEDGGFTHATANAEKLLTVANHFYTDVPGEWLCLQMTQADLEAAGARVVWEGTAPVGDKPANFDGNDDELFPHIYAGLTPTMVLAELPVQRTEAGEFLSIEGLS